jgi:hypothetical protein
MFQSAAIKLTTWYIAIVMALSIGCSIALYNVSSNDLENNIHRRFLEAQLAMLLLVGRLSLSKNH